MLPRRRKVCTILLAIAIGMLFVLYLHQPTHEQLSTVGDPDVNKPHITDNCDEHCEAYLTRLDKYCHRSLLETGGQHLFAQEGRLTTKPTNSIFHLEHVHIVARHGDRTPIEPYKIGSRIFYQCGLVNKDENWNGLRDFPLPVPLPSSARISNSHLNFHPGTENKRCGVGKLTEIGFKQHHILGSLMKRKYESLLSQLDDLPHQLFVQSTDISRTIHSGVAFLLGFLPDDPEVRKATQIHVSRGTLNSYPPVGIQPVYQQRCAGYHDLYQGELVRTGYYNTHKRRYQHLLEKLLNMFHILKRPHVTKLFDHFMTRGCHNRNDPLPCSRVECPDFTFAHKVAEYSDWDFMSRYPPNSSTISALPFLTHSVFSTMDQVVMDEEDSYKFMLTFTHDNTMTMILSTLGLQLDKWMPYASRITFELWREEKEDEYYVRVLFNGGVVTQEMTSWKRYRGAEGSRASEELVPFEMFSEFITTGPYRGVKAYNSACKNNN